MIRVLCLLPFLLLASCRPNKLSSSHHPGLHNHHDLHDHHHHDEDVLASQTVESYLSPSAFGERETSASQAVDSYLPPPEYEYDEELPAASQAVDSYLIPEQEPAASRAVESYLGPAPEVLPLASQIVDNYLVLPELEPAASRAVDSYLVPEEEVEPAASRAVDSYLVPGEDVSASTAVDSYLLPEQEPAASRTLESYFGSSDREAAPSQTKNYYSLPTSQVLEPQASVVRTVTARAPIAIIREVNTGPQDGNYNWNFETENGISQSVEGRMKMVADTPVYVMQGEYSYPGADGNMWKVEWYADETGYHPSAPFLPKNVVPNHPEVLAAVNAQLRFAAEEQAAAASVNNQVFALPESSSLAGYGGEQEELEGYGQQELEGYGQEELEGYGQDLEGYGQDLQGYAKL